MKVSSLGLPPRLLIFSDYRSIFKEMSLLKYGFNGNEPLKIKYTDLYLFFLFSNTFFFFFGFHQSQNCRLGS